MSKPMSDERLAEIKQYVEAGFVRGGESLRGARVAVEFRAEIERLRAELQTVCNDRDYRLAQADKRVADLREALEHAPHDTTCDHEQRFIHLEPCPYWTQGYCLSELGETQSVGCHPGRCSCWKYVALSAPAGEQQK